MGAPELGTASDYSGGNGFRINENAGLLGIFQATGPSEKTETSLGMGEFVPFSVVVVDGGPEGNHEAGEVVEGRAFPVAIRGQLSRAQKQGRAIVGRIGQGEAQKGRSAPWLLVDPTAEERKAAEAVWRKHNAPPF